MSELPSYLLDVLNSIAVREGFLKHSIEQEPRNANNHDGFVGTILSIRLVGERKSNGPIEPGELSLICKLLPDDEIQRSHHSSEMLFVQESYFYNTIVSAFKKFQEEKRISVEELGFFQIPKCYAAICVPERNEFLVVMENLRVAGFEIWPKEKPLLIEHVRLTMAAIGRLHGLSFAMRDQLPTIFKEFCKMNAIRLRTAEQPKMHDMFLACYRHAISTMETDLDIAVIKRVRDTFRKTMDDCANGAEQFAVIGHNDLWINNIMFKDLEKMCILDWQMVGLCSPASDISFFLLSSTDKELRDQYYDELINIYYDELCAIVQRCGSNPSVLFSRKNLNDQLRRFGKEGLTMAPFLLQLMVANESEMVDVESYSVNVEEHGAHETPYFVSFTEQSKRKYIKQLSDVIADCIKYGWIDVPGDLEAAQGEHTQL